MRHEDDTTAAGQLTRDPETHPAPGGEGPPGPLLKLIRDQRIAFLLVGGINTAVGFGWFVLFQLVVGDRLGQFGYMATLILAHIASVLCAFVLHRRFVFRVRGHMWIDLLRFESVNLLSLGVNIVILPVLVEAAGLLPIVAQAIITVITTIVSWFGHKYFSFRRRPVPGETAGR